MNRYLGKMGSLYLIRELKNLGFNSVSELNDSEKIKLTDSLIQNVFSQIASRQKLMMIRSEIMHELSVSSNTLYELSQHHKKIYETTENVV